MTALRWSVAAVAAAIALAGCDQSSPPPLAEPEPPHVTIAVEPEELLIGERGVVKITVSTPVEHRLSPILAPSAPPALEIMKVETAPVFAQSRQWTHVTRFHIRAREVGEFLWPPGALEFTAPDGTAQRMESGSLLVRVASVLPNHPDRTTPFGARPAPPTRARTLGTAGAALVALLLLAAIGGLIAIHWRLRRGRQAPTPSAASKTPSWSAALEELARARDALATDATGAADTTATALRRYVGGRFGAPATARTTEEIAAAMPPFAARSRWPTLVELLRDLDSLRFPARQKFDSNVVTGRVEELVRRAESFVEASTPPEALR